jgi:hypothetical protein
MIRSSRATAAAARKEQRSVTPSEPTSTFGTAAIHAASGAPPLNLGDEVITTPITDRGTVEPIRHTVPAAEALPVWDALTTRQQDYLGVVSDWS